MSSVDGKPAPDAMREALNSIVEVANYGAKKLEEVDRGYVTGKVAGALNNAAERFCLISREAKAALSSVPVPPPNGAADFPRFLSSSSENNAPRVARCLFAADLSDEDHRKIATTLIQAKLPPSDDVCSALADDGRRVLADRLETSKHCWCLEAGNRAQLISALRSAPVSSPSP